MVRRRPRRQLGTHQPKPAGNMRRHHLLHDGRECAVNALCGLASPFHRSRGCESGMLFLCLSGSAACSKQPPLSLTFWWLPAFPPQSSRKNSVLPHKHNTQRSSHHQGKAAHPLRIPRKLIVSFCRDKRQHKETQQASVTGSSVPEISRTRAARPFTTTPRDTYVLVVHFREGSNSG